ncbi:hypothetical protein [Alicyclobacillus dauci]|uniref:Uncharacterized protein n=1 Tax=Alicyclobacillus dauci TaxID=1475485 RepID=A0ABY6Z6B3_9BACL|nr:hypothetical protein [Alicyclobacillus dauci]WAH38152.1 hypothetical protein NZD86_06605 [Alicyclobacillus dauci]
MRRSQVIVTGVEYGADSVRELAQEMIERLVLNNSPIQQMSTSYDPTDFQKACETGGNS